MRSLLSAQCCLHDIVIVAAGSAVTAVFTFVRATAGMDPATSTEH